MATNNEETTLDDLIEFACEQANDLGLYHKRAARLSHGVLVSLLLQARVAFCHTVTLAREVEARQNRIAKRAYANRRPPREESNDTAPSAQS